MKITKLNSLTNFILIIIGLMLSLLLIPGRVHAAITEVSATNDVTTTDINYDGTIPGMQVAPGSGDYLVFFSASIGENTDSTSTIQRVSLFRDSTGQITESEREVESEGSMADAGETTSFPVSIVAKVTGVGASEKIEVRWKTTASTAVAHERTLTVIPITASDASQVSATASNTTCPTTAYGSSEMNSMKITTPGAGDYLVWFSTSVENSSTNHQYVKIYYDGTAVDYSEREIYTEGSITNTSFPMGTIARITNLSASGNIEVRCYTEGGTMTVHERTLVAYKIDESNTYIASATADSQASNTSYALINSMNIPTPPAGNYVAWFSGSLVSETSDRNQLSSIYKGTVAGGTRQTHTERQSFDDGSLINGTVSTNGEFIHFSQAYFSLSGSEDVEVGWIPNGGSAGTATIHERTLMLMKEPAAGPTPTPSPTPTNTPTPTATPTPGPTPTPGGLAPVSNAGRYDKLTDGLIGWWKMDESSPNTCSGGEDSCDSSGNGNHGDWNGTAGSTSGKFSNGTTYDGDSDYTQVSSPDLPTGDFTYTAWVNPTANTDERIFMASNGALGSGENEMSIYLGSCGAAGDLCADLNGVTVFSPSSPNVSTGEWTHIAITRSNGTIKGYHNGTEYSETAFDDTILNFSTCPLFIGTDVDYDCDSSLGNYFAGKMDDLRIYNRALQPREVRQLYNWGPPPIGYWNFDENTGTASNAVKDRSGNGNHGTMEASMTESDWVSGKYGSALDFDGTDDYVSLGDLDLLENQSMLTISAWVYYETYTQYDAPFGKRDGNNDRLAMGPKNTGTPSNVEIHIADGSDTSGETTTGIINENVWQYWTMVFDGTQTGNANRLKFYLNGIEKPLTYTGTIPASTPDTAADAMIGSQNPSSGNVVNGIIDDVRVYNYARTQSQIIEDMNAGHPIGGSPVGSQVGYWKFDEGYGDTAYDSSPQGNNGNLAGATTCPQASSACPTWSNSGKFNKALIFDGIDDYIDTGFNTSFEKYTLTAWIYLNGWGENNRGRIIEKRESGSEVLLMWVCESATCAGNQGLKFNQWFDQNGAWYINQPTLGLNQWYHVAVTYDASSYNNDPLMYVNGVSLPVGEETTPSSGTYATNSDDYIIGNRTNDQDRTFDGLIDEVKIYNTILTPEQILIDYNQGKAAVMGSLSTDGTTAATLTASNAASREFCIPGDTSTCNPPVGWWKMDENTGSGSNAVKDLSGNNYHCTMNGTLNSSSWWPGKFGTAMKYTQSTDGNGDDQLNCGDPANGDFDFGVYDSFTLSIWAKVHYRSDTGPLPTTFPSDNQNLLIKGGDPGWRLRVRNNGDPDAFFQYRYVTGSVSVNTNTIQDYKWHHISIVRDVNAGYFYSYTDGVLFASAANFDGSTDNASVLEIGDDANEVDGLIDDVRIYRYARTPAQVIWDYSRGAPIAWWRLDECAGTTAYDASKNANGDSNGNHGTITIGTGGDNTSAGTCDSGVSTQAWNNGTNGKLSASLDFDGSDDEITISDTSNLRFDDSGQNFSLFTWVKRTTTGTEYLISKEDADNDGYRLQFNSSNQVLCSVDSTDETSSQTITDTSWHYIGCTFDRSGNAQVYINGRADGSGTSISGEGAMATTTDIHLGTRSYTSTDYFNGQIDDFKIWNYALTAEQVKMEFNQGAVSFHP